MREQGITQFDLAERLEVTQGAIGHWLNGRREPKLEMINKILSTLGLSSLAVTPASSISDAAVPSSIDRAIEAQQKALAQLDTDSDRYVHIPLLDVEIGAGMGRVIDTERVKDWVPISNHWVNEHGYSAEHLAVVQVAGDSMEPRIYQGDLLLIDTSDVKLRSDNVYAISVHDEIRVKRLRRDIDGGWALISDNPSYPPEVISPEVMDRQVRVVGKVVRLLMGRI